MIGYVSVGLLGLLALSIPVGIVLFLLGFGIDTFFSSFPLTRGLGNMVWSSSNSATLIAIPFFVLLGEVLVRGGVATRNIRSTGSLGVLAAWWFGPCQHRDGHDVFGHVRLVGCDGRDRRNGRDAPSGKAGL